MPRREERQEIVFWLSVEVEEEHRDLDDSHLHDLLSKHQPRLVADADVAVRRQLGGRYHVEQVRIMRGSIELLVVVSGFASVVIFYGNLRQGVFFLRDDLRSLLERLMSRIGVPASVTAHAPLIRPSNLEVRARDRVLNRDDVPLVRYLVWTNIVLLGTVLTVLALLLAEVL